MLANALLAWIDAAVASYRTLFDKDALRRHSVPLGLDLNAISEDAFDALVDELRRLEPVAATAPQVSDELAWQYVDERRGVPLHANAADRFSRCSCGVSTSPAPSSS